MLSQIDEALEDFKNGKMLVVVDNEDRENEGDIIFNAKFADQEKMNFCIQNAGGLVCIAISQEIADKTGLQPMQRMNRDVFETAFYDSVDGDPKYSVSTGISANDRAITANLFTKKNVCSEDFRKPGHLFPIVAKKYGTIERNGHTEAGVDLSKLCGLPEAAIMCEVIDKNGKMMRRAELEKFCKKHSIKMISVEQIKNYVMLNSVFLEKSQTAKLPTEFGQFNIVSYRNPVTRVEHAVIFKETSKNKPIVRIHSECTTGDIFCSLKCDCNQQLHNTFHQIEKNGHGFLIYIKDHEGRGIGLFNKINAYKLQEAGLNTIEANEELGLLSDYRNYDDAVMIINDLKLNNFILLTGNNQKSDFLNKFGFLFEDQPMSVKGNTNNMQYLQDKIKLMNHKTILELPLNSIK